MTRYRFAFEVPPELGRQMREMIDEVRRDERPSRHSRRGVDLILELTRAGLDDYFLESGRRLGLGMVSLASVRLGLRTALGGISVFVKGLAGSLSDDQVRALAERLDELLIEEEEPTSP